MTTGRARAATLLVDGHVHLHSCYDTGAFLDAAYANFAAAAAHATLSRPFLGVLMLTESAGEDAFARLAAAARPSRAEAALIASVPSGVAHASRGSIRGREQPGWTFRTTAESCSLIGVSGSRRLVVVAGRQVAAAEGLEVLVFGTRSGVPDGLPLEEVLAAARRLGAVHAIPWGAGKWLFGRGRLLSGLIRSAPAAGFCLGDEGGRPRFWRNPRHFSEASARGLRVLRGTDPLPFSREAGRAGSFGFWLRRPLEIARPAAAVLDALRDPATQIRDYGRLEKTLPFLVNQLAMQRRKRARRAAATPEIGAGSRPAPEAVSAAPGGAERAGVPHTTHGARGAGAA